MRKLLVSLFVACVSSSALAETYLCIAEAAGGVKNINGAWEGVRIQNGQKYLLKGDKWFEFGKDRHAAGCRQNPKNADFLWCDGFYDVVFNKKNLRFRAFSPFGYVESSDDLNSLTPMVEVGTCSRID